MTTMNPTLSEREAPPAARAIDDLLRDPGSVVSRIEQGRGLPGLARSALLTIAAGSAVFGAAIGSYRGGIQILFAGVKLPLVMLVTTAICAPALTAIHAALGRKHSLQRDLSLVLSSLALASLVLGALAPVVLLAASLGVAYHSLVLLVVGCCFLAGSVGVSLFIRGLSSSEPWGRLTIGVLLLGLFGVVGTQTSWTLRPFLVRPRAPQPVFVRSLEGSFLEAVSDSSRSARGLYKRGEAPVPEEE